MRAVWRCGPQDTGAHAQGGDLCGLKNEALRSGPATPTDMPKRVQDLVARIWYRRQCAACRLAPAGRQGD